MKIECIVFSHSGHTKAVAEKVWNKLHKSGHDVGLSLIEPEGKLDLKAEMVEIKVIPDLKGCDVAIIGSPVHGGRISAPIRAFLTQVESLEGKKVVLLVTHFFRPGWGALQTLRELRKLCEEKGGEVVSEMNIKWFSMRRRREIEKFTDHLSSVI